MSCRQLGILALGALIPCVAAQSAGAADNRPANEPLSFNRDIRPILSNNCFACHGNDKAKRKAELRLDVQEVAHADRQGVRAIVPTKPSESELVRRITAADENDRMPPAHFGKKLTPREIDLLKRWIEQDGKYEPHWSLIPPQRPALPDVAHVSNPIDRFIRVRLAAEGLKPSAEADRRTLVRRVSFDLTGLPPGAEDVDAFLTDQNSDAYEKQVDRLLASPHYGERMAMYWLDLVRYADTIGYHSDNPRDIAPYRDWVIAAFNKNQPFDQFTIEQLAGDLLPNPTLWQKVASGYNRLLQTTEEGGAQPKEYQAKYLADRVRNFGSVWLGMTLGCAECHNHKFDPFTTREFYSLEAFFADVKEAPVGRREPGMLVPTAEQEAALKQADDRLAKTASKLLQPQPEQMAVALLAGRSTAWFDPTVIELLKQQRQRAELLKTIPRSLVSVAQPPREIRVLPRGNWLDDSGEIVPPAVPEALPALGIKDRRPTRLDLAQWLVAPEHPLTSRVAVNRLWKLFFGQGLARSLEDFGAQGEWPTHPELLDWLAVEFRESGWNLERLVKLMVMSQTYRQSSLASKELRERDPDNKLLARQARFRLDAEMVRDNALVVSGLLVTHIGGDSVKPYQPGGYWDYLNFPRRTYQHDHGDAQYRRGLYTHWQRTFLHPSLLAFDAPSREECTCERPRSNIPQQALVLLNDPTYVEAARVFAQQVLKDGGPSDTQRLQYAYRRALQRNPSAEEERILLELLRKHEQQFTSDPKAAEALLKVGEAKTLSDLSPSQLAAWTSVTRAILNLHEGITRE